jgi:DNA modification methylase
MTRSFHSLSSASLPPSSPSSSSSAFQRMRLVTKDEYNEFLKSHDSISIENAKVRLVRDWKIEKFEPEKFVPEEWTVWSFPDRGDWATHIGNYRGNWSPFIPRNLIHKYTSPCDVVCDPMVGSGTTLVECKLLGRNGIGVDINPDAIMVAMNRLDFESDQLPKQAKEAELRLYVGDARRLDLIKDETVDLIATHPPYCGIISYSKSNIPGDLSSLKLEGFLEEIGKVANECFRILKPGKYCAILIGDTRRRRHYIPINLGVLSRFLDAGFILKEDIIKLQHKMMSARGRWRGHSYDFYKIAHEHLYVFRKLGRNERASEFKYSKRWW